jgi:DNA-directed RNA polymerase specialized sigma24 family protein
LEEEEIAEMLGTSVANVYVLRNRGLAKLRQEYHKRLSQVQDF